MQSNHDGDDGSSGFLVRVGRPDFFSSRLDVKQEFLGGIGNLGVFVLIFLSVAGEAGKKGGLFFVVS